MFKKQYFKKLLGILMVFTFGIVLLGITQTTYASSDDFEFSYYENGVQKQVRGKVEPDMWLIQSSKEDKPRLIYKGVEYANDLNHNFSFKALNHLTVWGVPLIAGQVAHWNIYLDLNYYDVYIGDKNIKHNYTPGTSNEQMVLEISLLDYTPEDNERPAISGQENFVTNIDDAKEISFFQSYLTAYDETDGNVTDRIKVHADGYTANKNKLGTYEVIFKVDDLSGNEAFLTVYIRVVDVTVPVINGSTTVATVGMSKTYDIEAFKKTLTISDNVDLLTWKDIKVVSDNYTVNKDKIGTYEVVFEIEDKSGNKGQFKKEIKVIDDVIPTFSGVTKITTSNNTILTERDVRDQLTATDNVDGVITNRIELVEDNYTGKGNKVGTYTIKYSVTDNQGNTAYHTVEIVRDDKIPPVIWIQDGVSIKTTKTTPLTFDQIIRVLQATGQVKVDATTKFTLLMDEYSGNESTPGIYAYSIQARSINGSESIHNLAITVLNEVDDNDNDIDVNPDFDIVVWIKENKIPIIVVSSLILIVAGLFVFRKKRK